jgi:hypothetical protein
MTTHPTSERLPNAPLVRFPHLARPEGRAALRIVLIIVALVRFSDVWALALLSGDEALLTLLKAQADPATFWDRFAAHWQVQGYLAYQNPPPLGNYRRHMSKGGPRGVGVFLWARYPCKPRNPQNPDLGPPSPNPMP